MQKPIMLALLFFLTACGSSNSDSKADSVLIGTWVMDFNESCARVVTFNEDHEYASQIGCQSGNEVEMQITTGNYVEEGDKITITPVKSSCEDVKGLTLTFEISKTNLKLWDSGMLMSLRKLEDDGSTSSETYIIITGCFDEEGNFVRREVSDLPLSS